MSDSCVGAAPERDVAGNPGICGFPDVDRRFAEGVNRQRRQTPLLNVKLALTTPNTILIVGADRAARAFLADNLTADGYEVLEAGRGRAARGVCSRRRSVDLVVVDRDLPDGDGLELLRFVREADQLAARVDCRPAVIVTSGDPTPLERVRGFERGCDDYLDRAELSYTELRARIAALLRRRTRVADGRAPAGRPAGDRRARAAGWVDGRPVPLSSKEFSLLLTLAREPGACVQARGADGDGLGLERRRRDRAAHAHARLPRLAAAPQALGRRASATWSTCGGSATG